MTINSILSEMEEHFHSLHTVIEKPEYIKISNRNVFRYKNKTVNISMIQLMARIISGLSSANLLIENGLTQECNVLYRTLDEFQENITFLSKALLDNNITPLHQKYLDNFFEEEFDNVDSAFHSTQKRDLIPRDKIRAFIANIDENPVNPSDTQKNLETIDKFYSGFVHGTSTHIMDMYSDNPSKYLVRGLSEESPSVTVAQRDFEEYLYRSIFSMLTIALSFNETEVYEKISSLRYEFESQTGRDDYECPVKAMNKMKRKGK